MKNKLPEGWKEVELENLLLINKSGCWGDEADEKSGTPVIRSTNFTKDLKLKEVKIAYRKISKEDVKNKKLEYGDILLEKSGGGPGQPVGRVIIFNIKKERDFVCGNFIQILRPDKNKIEFNYLYYYLNLLYSQGFTENLFNKTTGIQNLRLKDYLKIKIPLPPTQTQQKIVSILEKAEKAKEWRKEADELTKELLKTVFMEMFGDPGKNPKKWKIIPIEGIALSKKGAIRMGPFGSQLKKHELVKEGVKVLWIENIVDNKFNPNGTKYITEEKYEQLKGFTVNKGDIVLTMMGTIGRVEVVPDIGKSIISSHLLKIEPDTSICNSIYLKWIIMSDFVQNQFKDASHGAVMSGLNGGIIKSTKIPLPPITLQQKFASTVKEVEAMKEQQKHSKEQIDNLFNALMQKAFKGELVV